MRATAACIDLVVEVPRSNPHWVLDDDEARMPESPLQAAICDLLKQILSYWALRSGTNALVSSNIALRWDKQHPRSGVDPDVYLVEPAPPLGPREKSLRTWVPGHKAPRVCIEVVSDSTNEVDYNQKPAKYAASGTHEVWIFDPLMVGPGMGGEAFRLQVWRREKRTGFRRVYAGDGPAQSKELGAWLLVTDGGMRLRIADDEAGTTLWPTEAEAARAAERAERVAKELAIIAKKFAIAAQEKALAAEKAALAEVEMLRRALARVTRDGR